MFSSTTDVRPQAAPGNSAFTAYTEALESGDTPLLGHVVVYSIFDGKVTPDRLESWLRELGLDLRYLPGGLRADSAFKKVTGAAGVQATYPLEDSTGRKATLMVRPVRRDQREIVRHVVREVRDEQQGTLSYDSKIGEVVFKFARGRGHAPGDGTLHVTPDYASILALPESEQAEVQAMLKDIADAYRQRCMFYSGDQLRAMVHTFVEDLGSIKIRPTGGVYFVHRQHCDVLAALRTLVSRFGEGSKLERIPISDQDEMRDMIVTSLTTQTRDELRQLSTEIATAQREGATEQAVQKLLGRAREVEKLTADHSQLLSISLADTGSALKLVQSQLKTLFLASSQGTTR